MLEQLEPAFKIGSGENGRKRELALKMRIALEVAHFGKI